MSRRSRNAVALPNKPTKPQRYKGPFVYKYGTCEHLGWLKPILLEHRLYFPTPPELNDPAEAHPRLSAASEKALIQRLTEMTTERKVHLKNEPAMDAKIIAFNVPRFGVKTLLDEMERSLHPHLETFHIYSLSKRPNNEHLWKRYAVGHTGYCLEFRTEGIFEQVFAVRYADNVALDITDDKQAEPFFLFYKTKSWSKEEEIRAIGHRSPDPTVYFEPHLLTRAILGSKIEPGNAAQIREWATDRDPPLVVVSESEIGRPRR